MHFRSYFLLIRLIFVIVNPACIKPIHGFQIRILGGIADAHNGIGFHILGQDQEGC